VADSPHEVGRETSDPAGRRRAQSPPRPRGRRARLRDRGSRRPHRRGRASLRCRHRHRLSPLPDEDALFEAIVIARIERVTAYAEELARAPDPGAAFFDFLDRLVADGVAKKDLVEALGLAGVDLTAQTEATKSKLRRSLGKLIARAQDAHAVRPDLTANDLLSLVRGLFAATGTDARARARHLAILSDGLRRR
jgi:hypothetical protein